MAVTELFGQLNVAISQKARPQLGDPLPEPIGLPEELLSDLNLMDDPRTQAMRARLG